MSEGYIAKIQKKASNKLDIFKNDLYKYILKQKLIYWEDTVITMYESGKVIFQGTSMLTLLCGVLHQKSLKMLQS